MYINNLLLSNEWRLMVLNVYQQPTFIQWMTFNGLGAANLLLKDADVVHHLNI